MRFAFYDAVECASDSYLRSMVEDAIIRNQRRYERFKALNTEFKAKAHVLQIEDQSVKW